MRRFWYRTFPRLTHFARRLVRANYEREMELLDVLCDPARTGIDVGAKVGMYTYRIRQRSSDVLAFEPIPLFHSMLTKVFQGKRGRIEPFAVSNTRGLAVLRMPFDQTDRPQFGRSTIHGGNALTHELVARTEELEVETRRIDDYELGHVGFVKVDVEGHEIAVLDGAEATIAKHKPNLLVECNDDHQVGGPEQLVAWLRAHEYDAWFLSAQGLTCATKYERAEHWEKSGIENFIGIHRSRPDALARLQARAAVMPWRHVE